MLRYTYTACLVILRFFISAHTNISRHKTRTQQLVQKIVKNTVEVLHSVQHDIPLAAECGWREDVFCRVLYASANTVEQGNYLATDGGYSSNSSANKRNRERRGSAVITEQLNC